MNHYKIDGPAIIAFSGGATSGYMLWRILQAHGGTLPQDVVPVFANTGLEHPKTYEFIQACQDNWGVKIRWVEFTGNKQWKEVDFQTASRKGEPFDILTDEKNYLPNPVTRFCTGELKVKTMARCAESMFGTPDFTEVIGLRKDEPHRIAGMSKWSDGRDLSFPLYSSGATQSTVDEFWSSHPFKLGIPRAFGNCVGCFLKGAGTIAFIAETEPEHLEWWEKREAKPINGKPARFRSDRPSYKGLIQMAQDQQTFCFPNDETIPCACTD